MSTYRDGLAIMMGQSGVGLIPGFATPDGVLDHMHEIASAFDALDLDMRNAADKFTRADLAAYEDLKEQWRDWYPNNSDWSSRFFGTGELSDKCDEFSRKIQYYRDALQKKGAPVSGPDPTKPATPVLEQLGKAASDATGASSGYLKAGMVIAGIFAAGFLIKEVREAL